MINENSKEALRREFKELIELLSDLEIAISDLDLTEEQLAIIEPVSTKLGTKANDLQEEIYLT